jgi:hypothetical protein
MQLRTRGAGRISALMPRTVLTALLSAMAFVVFGAFNASAQSVTLTPGNDVNPTGGSITINATVSGISGTCSANADNAGSSCTRNADCGSVFAIGQVYCDLSGYTVFLQVTGANSIDTSAVTDKSGVAKFPYTDVGGAGTDTATGCLDLGEGGVDDTSAAECIGDTFEGGEDVASSPVSEYWTDTTISLSPSSALNASGGTHSVTASIVPGDKLGVCTGGGNSNQPCDSVSDCVDQSGTCDLSGYPVGFLIGSGPNAQDLGFVQTDVNGNATSPTYTDNGGPGKDVIQACIDIDGKGGNGSEETSGTASCIQDAAGIGGDSVGEDQVSNKVTKTWQATPNVVLSESAVANPVGGSHEVDAAISGGKFGVCTAGANQGLPCDVATASTDCPGNVGFCDASGWPIGFIINSGPNAGDLGFTNSGIDGTASNVYIDNGGAGLDTIQACLDGDPLSNGSNDENGNSVANCINDGATDFDYASNTVQKRWEGPATLTLSPQVAFNPAGPGFCHTVTAAIVGGKLGLCTAGTEPAGTGCDTAADCGAGGVCDHSGFPIGFNINSGPNSPNSSWQVSDASGTASFNYCDNGGDGEDILQACLDTDTLTNINDEPSVSGCIADASSSSDFGDFASNPVTKDWIANYVTGGGGANTVSVNVNKKKTLQFAGTVGIHNNSAAFVGQWQEVSWVSGKTVSCHWNTFTSVVFSGPPISGSPGSTHNTVTFTTGTTTCTDGTQQSETVSITDTGKSKTKDSINVSSGNPDLGTGGQLKISTGNFTIHDTQP